LVDVLNNRGIFHMLFIWMYLEVLEQWTEW
jgi:hypothetical protein